MRTRQRTIWERTVQSWTVLSRGVLTAAVVSAILLTGCGGGSDVDDAIVASSKAESCMSCHNGALHDDYSGPGMENPHPFPGGGTLKCTSCHGGDPTSNSVLASHVPPPPEVGDRAFQANNATAYFNRLTLTGLDKFEDYEVDGKTYTALDYIEFINPGDLRVVTKGKGCGKCHMSHAECVAKSPLATSSGILSGAMYAIGVDNQVPGNVGLYGDTAADLAFRPARDAAYLFDADNVGAVEELYEFPVFSIFREELGDSIFRNQDYNVFDLVTDQNADGSVVPNSPLANLFHEQVAFTCGDCHLGSAGANNRYGDFRSSGCTSCHMQYALDGRSRSTDPNINKLEPADPDDIDAPERPHVRRHMISSIARTLPSGEQLQGIDDYACAGCHQGSNRTVMQYWGIRLDQNADLRRRVQYPANPVSFQNTARDTRLFDPVVGNRTFNGRNANQYILFEDYDGDGRDDTPPDVHYEAGLGCIDCHGSHDLHGGKVGDPAQSPMVSRQEQAVGITCEACHGTATEYAASVPCTTYDDIDAECAVDREGNPLRHVVKAGEGDFYLTSRLDGRRHYIRQTKDTVVDSGKLHPFTGEALYSVKASYAMGIADGDDATGIGPLQGDGTVPSGFTHGENMSCVACHASWTNSCIGCHLGGEYDEGNNFSNITGDRIVFDQANADFVYQTPVPFQLGVDVHNKIAPITPNTETFWQYEDLNGDKSKIFTFSDRNGGGSNRARAALPSLSHNVMMPHSIRGKVTPGNEGVRYCTACHLTDTAVDTYRTEYDAFRAAMREGRFADLDFDLLKTHIGQNPGNQLNSPFWVHMVSGLGSGLFLVDENGCPTNPLDEDDRRVGCNHDDVEPDLRSPADRALDAAFDLNVAPSYNLDTIVDEAGRSTGSNNHRLLRPVDGPLLRDDPDTLEFSGPLSGSLIEKLSNPDTGIILDGWIDADGAVQGTAGLHVVED